MESPDPMYNAWTEPAQPAAPAPIESASATTDPARNANSGSGPYLIAIGGLLLVGLLCYSVVSCTTNSLGAMYELASSSYDLDTFDPIEDIDFFELSPEDFENMSDEEILQYFDELFDSFDGELPPDMVPGIIVDGPGGPGAHGGPGGIAFSAELVDELDLLDLYIGVDQRLMASAAPETAASVQTLLDIDSASCAELSELVAEALADPSSAQAKFTEALDLARNTVDSISVLEPVSTQGPNSAQIDDQLELAYSLASIRWDRIVEMLELLSDPSANAVSIEVQAELVDTMSDQCETALEQALILSAKA